MILHKPERIEEYREKGFWGDRTLLERFSNNCAAHPEREAIVDPPDHPGHPDAAADGRAHPVHHPGTGNA